MRWKQILKQYKGKWMNEWMKDIKRGRARAAQRCRASISTSILACRIYLWKQQLRYSKNNTRRNLYVDVMATLQCSSHFTWSPTKLCCCWEMGGGIWYAMIPQSSGHAQFYTLVGSLLWSTLGRVGYCCVRSENVHPKESPYVGFWRHVDVR